MYLDIDDVAVPGELWERARAGDKAARTELRTKLNGLQLYDHILSVQPNRLFGDGALVWVTLRELREARIVSMVTISTTDGAWWLRDEQNAAARDRA